MITQLPEACWIAEGADDGRHFEPDGRVNCYECRVEERTP